MKIVWTIIILAVLAVGGYFAYQWYDAPEVNRVKVEEGKITDVAPMLRLCSVEIYDEIPVKGQIGSRHLVAKASMKGSISFDLDSVQMTESADTLLLTLPREIVEVFESTEPDSYVVIDNWSDDLFGSGNFTTAEENSIKKRAKDTYRAGIYKRGLVKRARKEASDNLSAMLSAMTGKTVIVTDPQPEGYIK